MRYWFGIDSRLDERQLAEVERIGNNAYIVFSLTEMIMVLISLCFAFTTQLALAYYFLVLATAILTLLLWGYTNFALNKLQILHIEITPDERLKAVRTIYLKAIIEGIVCFIPCMIGSAFGSSVANNGSMVNILSFWPQGLWASICVGGGVAIDKFHRLKVIKD
ncbi:DUF3278 domain-containing protein [Lactobacillus helveticus]|uniref:DUF3278 domain-containing protein n=1 Tax=Lactobacillus helveticus TaxID=1587 RepID=UPI002150F805|nr:DUF3278 domain-containing protein [Lactobacillus helveticus]